MLEIIALIFLGNKNVKNAKKLGKSVVGVIGYTLGLWIGLEIFGATIGGVAGLGMGSYLLALLFAIGGGVASYYITKSDIDIRPLTVGLLAAGSVLCFLIGP